VGCSVLSFMFAQLKKIIRGLFGRSHTFAVVFLGDDSLSYVVMSPESEGLRIVSYGSRDIPKDIIAKSVIYDEYRFQSILEQLYRDMDTRNVHILLPSITGYRFSAYIPKEGHALTRYAVEIELRDHVYRNTGKISQDLVCEYEITESDQFGGTVEAFVLSADVVKQITKLFRMAKMRVLTIETMEKSLAGAGLPDEGYIMVHVGDMVTDIMVVSSGAITKRQRIQVGQQHLIDQTQRHLGVDEGRSLEIFQSFGLLPAHKDAALLERLEFTLEPLLITLQKTLQDWHMGEYQRTTERISLDKLVLIGKHGGMIGLDHYLVRNIRMPVEYIDLREYVLDGVSPIPRDEAHQFVPLVLRAKEIVEKGE
jgi:Tfp pilus assembly PilM family ATPase